MRELRDVIAVRVMEILLRPENNWEIPTKRKSGIIDAHEIARESWRIADAMIRARRKGRRHAR
jgi:hypothetical protein